MRRSLRTRLTILCLVIAILPLLLVACFGIQLSVNVQNTQSIAQQQEIAKEKDDTAIRAESPE